MGKSPTSRQVNRSLSYLNLQLDGEDTRLGGVWRRPEYQISLVQCHFIITLLSLFNFIAFVWKIVIQSTVYRYNIPQNMVFLVFVMQELGMMTKPLFRNH